MMCSYFREHAMKGQSARLGIMVAVGLSMSAVICMTGKEGNMPVFTMSDKNETHVRVKAGEFFSLQFVTSPGTGYAWMLDAPVDPTMLTIMEIESEAPKGDLVGAGENEVWVCRALRAGRSEIAVKYARPWEKGVPALKKHAFKIHCK
jgi:inhibitor of cysteine peptidase